MRKTLIVGKNNQFVFWNPSGKLSENKNQIVFKLHFKNCGYFTLGCPICVQFNKFSDLVKKYLIIKTFFKMNVTVL